MKRVASKLCRIRGLWAASGAIAASIFATAAAHASLCTDLQQLNVPNAEIRSATDIAAGPFAPEGDKTLLGELPAFCRVEVVAHPVPSANVAFELWMPAATKSWNHRIESFGSEGYGGTISFPKLAAALRQGYASTSLSSGFGTDFTRASQHPDSVVDWAYRGVHATAQAAKRIVAAYYQHGAEHAYFNGCGIGGGTQALSEAEQYPQDYDGILAGDPPADLPRVNAGLLLAYAAAHAGGSRLLTDDALHTLHAAAIAACDAKDGLKDGVLEEPSACKFDAKATQCHGGSASGCLSPEQITAARAIYSGPRAPDSKNSKELLVSGLPPGSELGWAESIAAPDTPPNVDFWRVWVKGRRDWDWHTFDPGRDLALAEEKLTITRADNPELRNFRLRGGKIILYHGWEDGLVPAGETIEFFNELTHEAGGGEETDKFARLYLIPGMGYCGGGDVSIATGTTPPDAGTARTHDLMSALDTWISKNTAPDVVIARRQNSPDDARKILPICGYPMSARFSGKGDPNDVGSYSCLPMK